MASIAFRLIRDDLDTDLMNGKSFVVFLGHVQSNTTQLDVEGVGHAKRKFRTEGVQANVQAIDVNFSQDLTHQKSFKLVNFLRRLFEK